MNGEKDSGSGLEKTVEFSKDQLGELYEQQKNKVERAAELKDDRNETEQSARHEIEKITAEKETAKQEKPDEHPVGERKINTKEARKKAYGKIMKQTQAELSPTARAFSKFLHNPAVDKASEVAGKTIARPNAILYGSLFAFTLTLVVYAISRINGYPISGSETIVTFIIGWIAGNLYDFFKVMITGKR